MNSEQIPYQNPIRIEEIIRPEIFSEATNKVRTGGEPFCNWAGTFLKDCFNYVELHGLGGLVVPQIGEGVGRPFSFITIPLDLKCINLDTIIYQIDEFWKTIQNESKFYFFKCNHEKDHIVLIITPIGFGFDRPIGYFWVVVDLCSQNVSKMIVEYASNFVGLIVRAEKTHQAIKYLSQDIWTEATTSERTAQAVAEACNSALSCRATVVWELDHKTKVLKKLSSAGNAKNLKLDMLYGKGIAGICAETGKTITLDDLLDYVEIRNKYMQDVQFPQIIKEKGWRSAVMVPLDIGGRTAGVFAVFSPRPRGFSKLDTTIAVAFAQRLCAGYVHVDRFEKLTEIERKISIEASAIEAGLIAMERVHDVVNSLVLAQSRLSEVAQACRLQPDSNISIQSLAASKLIDEANNTLKVLVRRSRLKKIAKSNTNITELVNEAIKLVKQAAGSSNIQMSIKCIDNIVIKADKDQLLRVFLNILDNALFFLETDTKGIKKTISVTVEKKERTIELIFFDNGPGIAPYYLDQVFDYFFTTKGERGLGFGLAISHRIIREHGGKMTVNSKWGYETEFLITLPID